MAHKVIIEWPEEKIRLDYYQYLLNESSLKKEAAKRKSGSLPIDKIIKNHNYLKSFGEYEMIDVLGEHFKVELKLKNK